MIYYGEFLLYNEFEELLVLLQELGQDLSDISVQADGAILEHDRAGGFAKVQTGVGGAGVLRRQLPEGVFDDDGGVVAHAQLQIQDPAAVGAEEILIPFRRPAPALVLHEFII